MKIAKFIGKIALGALVVSAIPYQFKKDIDTGAFEIRSLLWGVRKIPRADGEEKDHFVFTIPASALDSEDLDEEATEDDEFSEEQTAQGEPAEA